jgi:heme-degrading monooxygenase HmoA
MFMRFVRMRINPDKVFQFEALYERVILKELESVRGCLYAGLVQSLDDQSDGLSLTLWERKEDADDYERSGMFAKMIDQSRPYFSDSSGWGVHLTDHLELEYRPESTEPEVMMYADVSHRKEPGFAPGSAGSLCVRVVTMRMKPERLDEAIAIYNREITPELLAVDGCRHAFLARSMEQATELLSITIWESLAHIRRYEAEGKFDELLKKLRHTLSGLYLWKMEVEGIGEVPQKGGKTATSDDITVKSYSVVTARLYERGGAAT